MEPLAALALAGEAIKFADGLLNAYIATKATVDAAGIEVSTARLAALKQANDELSARVHLELQGIIAKAAS